MQVVAHARRVRCELSLNRGSPNLRGHESLNQRWCLGFVLTVVSPHPPVHIVGR